MSVSCWKVFFKCTKHTQLLISLCAGIWSLLMLCVLPFQAALIFCSKCLHPHLLSLHSIICPYLKPLHCACSCSHFIVYTTCMYVQVHQSQFVDRFWFELIQDVPHLDSQHKAVYLNAACHKCVKPLLHAVTSTAICMHKGVNTFKTFHISSCESVI